MLIQLRGFNNARTGSPQRERIFGYVPLGERLGEAVPYPPRVPCVQSFIAQRWRAKRFTTPTHKHQKNIYI